MIPTNTSDVVFALKNVVPAAYRLPEPQLDPSNPISFGTKVNTGTGVVGSVQYFPLNNGRDLEATYSPGTTDGTVVNPVIITYSRSLI